MCTGAAAAVADIPDLGWYERLGSECRLSEQPSAR